MCHVVAGRTRSYVSNTDGCHCKDGVCSPLTCECVLEGGRTYSPDGSLFVVVVVSLLLTRSVRSVNGVGHLVECNRKCLCDPETCRNRVLQNTAHTVVCGALVVVDLVQLISQAARYPLQIVKTAKCGFGVVTVLPIPAGQFVCEYLGQIISEAEAQRLQKEVYVPLQLNYIWTDCNNADAVVVVADCVQRSSCRPARRRSRSIRRRTATSAGS